MDFLDVTARRNPELIKVATELHQSGQIPANTVVIDLDTVKHNAEIIKNEADKNKISNYFMMKQAGRNPLVSKVISDLGMSAIAVDIEGCKSLHRHGIPVGHVGHLSQIPNHDIKYVVDEVKPEVITVYSVEKAKKISEIAEKSGKIQDLLVRVLSKNDFYYPNQEGGFPEENIVAAVRTVNSFKGVKVVGITSFPVMRFNLKSRKEESLPNFDTMLRAASQLKRELGVEIKQINAPADTSAAVMKILAEKGATHGEPGHGFFGTTPWHAFADLLENPAWVYVSEVSHLLGERAFAYGGNLMAADMCYGFWTDLYQQFRAYTFVGHDPETIIKNKVLSQIVGYIDYYGPLYPAEGQKVEIGDTVLYGFRNQIFVSRAKVAVISGIQQKTPKLMGIFDRNGNMLDKEETPVSIEETRKLMATL